MDNSEYEIQHFGFPAAQISLERKHLLQKFLSTALEVMLEKLTTSTETRELLAKQKAEVSRRMSDALEEHVNTAEALDRKYFSIPSHVLLPQDFECTKQYTEADEQRLDEVLADYKKLFLENSIMIASLKMENSHYKSIEPFISRELAAHDMLEKSLSQCNLELLQKFVNTTKDMMKRY